MDCIVIGSYTPDLNIKLRELREPIACQAEETGCVLQEALDAKQMTIIVNKCKRGNAKMPPITMDSVVIRDGF